MNHQKILNFILFYVFLLFDSVVPAKVEQDTNPDSSVITIEKFRAKIQRKVGSSSPISRYLEDDFYILQWLKANSYNLKNAESHFLEHLNWRRKYNIDSILQEDWTEFSGRFPIFTNTADKYGRPISEVWLSDWNIRRGIMSGLGQQLIRWHIYRLEVQQKRLFYIRRHENVTGAVEIQDFQGFNAWTQGCPPCLSILTQMFLVWKKQYGGIMESIYMVNMGPSVYNFFKLLGKQMASAAAPEALKPFQNKGEWLPVLNSVIDRDQRSVRFGGSLDRKLIPLVPGGQGNLMYYF